MKTSAVHAQPVLAGQQEFTRKEERQVVVASTLGTLFEWYDFFIYGSLAVFMSAVLFPPDSPTASMLAALGALAVGFIIRPLGAIVFGYIGDKLGRKVTFLLTVVMMGGSTVLMGCLPSYATAGHLSWILLLLLRIVQGLAVGGEYGGAVVYLSEHCQPSRRGLLTSWLQLTCLGGLLTCLIVVVGTQSLMSPEAFKAWGWRVPFIASVLLLAVSVYIRAKLHESPVFTRMKKEGRLSKNPIRDAFGNWSSLKLILLALVTINAGTVSSFYAGQFYVMIFLQQAVGIEQSTVYKLIITGFLIAAPVYIFLGWLSDRVGRKWIMMVGVALTALLYRPMFASLVELGNPELTDSIRDRPVLVHAAVEQNACEFSMVAAVFGSHADNTKPCVKAKKYLVNRGVNFSFAPPLPGQDVAISVNGKTVNGYDAKAYTEALADAGYPTKANPEKIDSFRIILILIAMSIISAMTYAPVAAYLVELFPPSIRYTALSFPYHLGAGLFGGALPFFAMYFGLSAGDVLAGIWYPVAITTVSFIIGAIFLPNKRQLAED